MMGKNRLFEIACLTALAASASIQLHAGNVSIFAWTCFCFIIVRDNFNLKP